MIVSNSSSLGSEARTYEEKILAKPTLTIIEISKSTLQPTNAQTTI